MLFCPKSLTEIFFMKCVRVVYRGSNFTKCLWHLRFAKIFHTALTKTSSWAVCNWTLQYTKWNAFFPGWTAAGSKRERQFYPGVVIVQETCVPSRQQVSAKHAGTVSSFITRFYSCLFGLLRINFGHCSWCHVNRCELKTIGINICFVIYVYVSSELDKLKNSYD